YSFGANSITSSGGVGDCSSFVQYVFSQNGVQLPRTAESQYNSSKGTKISKNSLQAGDVIFSQGTYKSGISHVGIYAGNGKFIHNSSSGGTKISDLNSSYYQQHYAGAVRYTGANSGATSNSKILDIAESMKGHTKYDYTHKNSYTLKNGILTVDCAGFVTYVLQKAGVIKNGTNMTNYYKNKNVLNIKNINDLQAGDVIYYAGKNGKVWHMNIYAGNGYVVESTSATGGYRKVKMTDKYKKEFLTAIRFPQASYTTEETTQGTQNSGTSGNIFSQVFNEIGTNIFVAVSVAILFILTFYLLFKSFS
ncbi:MAG TPA: hypothetical protein DDW20_02695, partial [Firmicutes bacterium]|nr:hypothetical protein [Bacillota bacterium]